MPGQVLGCAEGSFPQPGRPAAKDRHPPMQGHRRQPPLPGNGRCFSAARSLIIYIFVFWFALLRICPSGMFSGARGVVFSRMVFLSSELIFDP